MSTKKQNALLDLFALCGIDDDSALWTVISMTEDLEVEDEQASI